MVDDLHVRLSFPDALRFLCHSEGSDKCVAIRVVTSYCQLVQSSGSAVHTGAHAAVISFCLPHMLSAQILFVQTCVHRSYPSL
jgi:hypothetical protein